MSSTHSDSESDVDPQDDHDEEVDVEPMLSEMEARKKKRLDQLAVARKKSLAVRKVKNEPKKKRIELQAQVNKQLYDAEVARVAELEKILALSEKRNHDQEAKLKRASKTLLKHKGTMQTYKPKPLTPNDEDQESRREAEEARIEHLMRQLYSG
jgi:hypothetical protein